MSFLAVAHVGRGSPDPRRCRPQGSCPSRRFEPARGFRRGPPDASRPCSMPLASLELPSRAFTPRGAVPALAGRCFLADSSSDHRRRRAPRIVVTAFTVRASSLPRAHLAADPGRRSRDDGSLQPLTRRPWARRRTAGTPASKPCSPRGSVQRRPLALARQGRPSVLSWGSVPPEFSPPRFRVRSLAEKHARRRSPPAHSSRRPVIAVALRDLDSDPGLASPGSVDPEVYRTSWITVERLPSSPGVLRAPSAPAASLVLALRALGRSVLPVPPLRRHPAPPCP